MKQRNSITPLLPLFAALLMAACSGSSTSNNGGNDGQSSANLANGEPTEVTFAIQLTSSTADEGMAKLSAKQNSDGSFSPDGANVTLTAAQANLERVELYLPYGTSCSDIDFTPSSFMKCEDETEFEDGQTKVEAKIKIYGPILVDLMTGATTPAIEALNIPSGTYRRVDLRIDDSSALNGNSLVASGTVLDNSSVVHGFALALRINEEIKIKNDVGFDVTTNTLNRLILGFEVEKWFASLNLANCLASGDLQLDGNDTLTIDESTESSGDCDDIEDTVADNIKASSIFFNDMDDDGHHSSNDDGPNHT